MSPIEIGYAGLAAFALLLALRCPIGIAMALVGLFGGFAVNGWPTTLFVLGALPFESVFPYGLSIVPLFVLMGTLAHPAGVSRAIYDAGEGGFGHRRGGLAMGGIAACAGFGAICGSSLATAATMARISIPEMRARGYDPAFAAATVAAGGTLGVLIPPSLVLVIYALLTQESVGKLFVAAFIPGLVAAALYLGAIAVVTARHPHLAPALPRRPGAERLRMVLSAWDVIALFVAVLGGLFLGLFSPTEAASVGVAGVIALGLARRRFTRRAFLDALQEAAGLTGMIFFILIGAALFNYFIEATRITDLFVTAVHGADLSYWQVVAAIILLYLVLGCFMDSISMVFLTLPFLYPIVQSYGMDPIWFGILMLSVVEIGLITPPVGMNLFIVSASASDVGFGRLCRAVVPFILADSLRIVLVAAFPALSLWLANLLFT